MAVTVRRQTLSRKKSIKTSAKSSSRKSSRFWVWFNEALALLCAALSLFLLLSFLSAQANWSAHPSRVTEVLAGAMGPVGRFVGTLLAGFFGWCSLVPVLMCSWLGIYFWNREDDQPLIEVRSWWMLALGLVGMMIISCAFIAAVIDPNVGGSIGKVISTPLVKYFNSFGAALILGAFLLASMALSSGQSIGTLVSSFWHVVTQSLRAIFTTTPRLVMKCIVVSWNIISIPLHAIGDALFHSPAVPRDIPRPKMRKNKIENDDDEESAPNTWEDEFANDTNFNQLPDDEEEEGVALKNQPPAVVERKVNQGKIADKELRLVVKKIQEQAKEQQGEEGFPDYQPPDIGLLTRGEVTPGSEDDEELREKSKLIEAKLKDFSVLGRVTHIHPGPVITLFEFEPAPGVKVGRIASLQDDLAMSLKASSIRIIAPIPKRGTVGIEVPNRHRDIVRLRDLLESEAFLKGESCLCVPIGKDTYGDPVVADISTMPHLLMAGATGTGKSVSINALLVSLLYRATPAELGLILIDPKILELSIYEDIPHLRVPVVTVPKQAKAVLDWAVHEMERRYRMMQKYGVRNIDSYNKIVSGEEDKDDAPVSKKKSKNEASKAAGAKSDVVMLRDEQVIEAGIIDKNEEPISGDMPITEELKALPKIVIVIDELADLMLSVGRDIEELITRLAQKARAAGIHLIVATQRPSVDVITGLIKANFPARLSFRVSSRIDSRTILDSMGAEKLLGRGDMLFMLPGAEALRRVHGAFVSDSEVKRVVSAIKAKCKPRYDQRIIAICEKALEDENQAASGANGGAAEEYDEMYDKAVELVLEKGQASTSMVQRAFRIGYNRAARIIEMMEREGIVGPMDGAKPREVKIPLPDDNDDDSPTETESESEPPQRVGGIKDDLF